MFKTLYLILFFVFSNKIILANTYKINTQTFNIYTPTSWQIAKDFPNSDFTFFGPFKNNRRPIISFSSTPLKNYELKIKDLENGQKEYQEGRKQWLKRNSGTLLNFKNYQQVKWKNLKDQVHTVGYSYNFMGENYNEDNYFFKCNGTIYNISTLMTFSQASENKEEISEILNSITCK